MLVIRLVKDTEGELLGQTKLMPIEVESLVPHIFVRRRKCDLVLPDWNLVFCWRNSIFKNAGA